MASPPPSLPPTPSPAPSGELLAAAVGGDERAFHRLVQPHRRELHVHAYRMLGSVHDAEDALQETLLRAWRSLGRFDGTRALRPWLYRITTNVCLDTVARRPARLLPIDAGPATDPRPDPESRPEGTWIEPFPDDRFPLADGRASPEARYEHREAVELAFTSALQHLTGRQRAVLILREVLGFTAREVADLLDTTVASVNSALQRARRTLDERLPGTSQQAARRALGDGGVRALVDRFTDAFVRGDVEAILALLTDDVVFAMPPYADWCRGRDAVARSWLMPEGPAPRLRYVVTSANGQPAVGTYLLTPEGDRYLPIALDVLTLRAGRVSQVVAFRTPTTFPLFTLPPELPAHS